MSNWYLKRSLVTSQIIFMGERVFKTTLSAYLMHYNYFESKDNLVTEVVNYYVDKIWAEYESLFQSDVPFPEKIKQIVFEKKIIADDIHEDFFNHFMQEYIEE